MTGRVWSRVLGDEKGMRQRERENNTTKRKKEQRGSRAVTSFADIS
jgi:hypothetical protein